MNEEVQKELTWAGIALVAFIAVLLFAGISEVYEIAIVIVSFSVSWLVVSYSVKNFGTGSLSKEDLNKELQAFAIILVIFLSILALAGVDEYATFAIATVAFMLTWLIRSAAIKKFSG
tara:strand:+ start:156 stop:509 length:354 start_codon:yes stop_codon:yes gene_type:complete